MLTHAALLSAGIRLSVQSRGSAAGVCRLHVIVALVSGKLPSNDVLQLESLAGNDRLFAKVAATTVEIEQALSLPS